MRIHCFLATSLAVFPVAAEEPPAGPEPESAGSAPAAGEAAKDAAATEEAAGAGEDVFFDQIVLKNGSVIIGEVVDLAGGTLTIKVAFGADGTVKVKWDQVASLETGRDHIFQLKNGLRYDGQLTKDDDGRTIVISGMVQGPIELENLEAINPPEKKAVELSGVVNFGASVADGNTQTKTASFNAEVVARSERQRLTIRGAWNYAEDSDSITARNTKSSIKYDFFLTERFFVFASALFEEDKFQDLSLRTALSAGPGYQFINKGDYTEWRLKDLELYAEAGLAFFNEDRRVAQDQRYLAGRWAINVDWPISSQVAFFHNHEGFPGLERVDDLYIATEQGLRFTIWENFVSTIQVNWKWDNTPSPGFERSDAVYLITLGYQFKM
ncbi:MAG: DUF481 domain-containing protein [Planctomycetota bacterium]|nr:DUF481 domain-containing protein [Planctomycetota bacterium]